MIAELARRLARLPPHQQMEAAMRAGNGAGEYAELQRAPDAGPLLTLDNMNYSRTRFQAPLPPSELTRWFEIEAGYGSVLGELELGPVIRGLEAARARASARAHGLDARAAVERVEGARVMTGHGAAGALGVVLSALRARNLAEEARPRNRLVFNVPTFCLADAFARVQGLDPVAVGAGPERAFMPSPAQLEAACTPDTLACVLTYPNNPMQSSWGAGDIAGLARLVAHCQRHGIAMIVDTIYQDLRWHGPPLPELFALAERSGHLYKLFSASKDRPFACGYRIGYALIDPALAPWAERLKSFLHSNTATLPGVWLAFEAVFRTARLEGGLRTTHFEPLAASTTFGFGVAMPSAQQLHARVLEAGLFEQYQHRLTELHRQLDADLERVHRWARSSSAFEVGARPRFGNMLALRVRDELADSGDAQLFFEGLVELGLSTAVGSFFGLTPDQGTWLRVTCLEHDATTIISALERLATHLSRRLGSAA